VDATGCLLRVDDTGVTAGADTAVVVGYETMTDIDTGTGDFPPVAALTRYWVKSSTDSATERPWFLIADDRYMWLVINQSGTSSAWSYQLTYGFGDFIPLSGSDSYNCILLCGNSTTTGLFYADGLNNGALKYVPRPSSGIGGYETAIIFGPFDRSSSVYLSGTTTYPSPVTGGLNISYPAYINQTSTTSASYGTEYPLRGKTPGLYLTAEDSSSLVNGASGPSILESIPGLSGIRLMPVQHGYNNSAQKTGVLIDITGPWR